MNDIKLICYVLSFDWYYCYFKCKLIYGKINVLILK